MDAWSLAGRRALVTGASTGLGEALALELAALGAAVALSARRRERLEEVAERIRAQGGTAVVVPADLAQPDGCAGAVAAAAGLLGGLDVLVNNAGAGEDESEPFPNVAGYERVVDLNLVAPYACAAAAYEHLRAAGGGAIVNVASIYSFTASPFKKATAYAASKAGLLGLTRDLASQWGREGIRVNAVAPGYFASEMTGGLLARPDVSGEVARRTALGRAGTLEEVARAAAFLCLPAASYVTGAVLIVDGGWLAR